MRVHRIFLSSTFRDFVWEREFLNGQLVPELNTGLAASGHRIDLLDLRWGVSRDAGLDNFAVDICMAEIRRSFVSGARPFFLYLGSKRPGWTPVPRILSADRFDMLSSGLNERSEDVLKLLESLYERDDNFLDPAYVLRNRQDFERDTGLSWDAAECSLRNLVADPANAVPSTIADSFSTPVTIQEVELGLQLVDGDASRIAALWREEKSSASLLHRLAKRGDAAMERDDSQWSDRVADMFRQSGAQIQSLTRKGSADERYRSEFADWAREALLRVVSDAPMPVSEERSILEAVSPPLVERSCLGAVRALISSNPGRPTLLYGSSGCGKSILSQQLANGLQKDGWATTIIRPGRERQRLDAEGFATLTLRTLEDRASAPPAEGRGTAALRERLTQDLEGRHLLLFDGIDECDWRDAGEAVAWLPDRPGHGLTIAVTTCSTAIRSAFEDAFGPAVLLDLPELTAEETHAAIDLSLQAAGRRLQDDQLQTLLSGLADMPAKAVSARLAGTIGKSTAAGVALPTCEAHLSAWVAQWAEHLERREGHGRTLIDAVFAILGCARRSVPERILYDAIKKDPGVVGWVEAAFPDALEIAELPRTAFSRLMGSIDDLLETREVDGELHVAFVHSALKEAAASVPGATRLEWARKRLLALYRGDYAMAGAAAAVGPHLLSELAFQAILLGREGRSGLDDAVRSAGFIALKTGPDAIGDTLEELNMLSRQDWLGSPQLKAFGRLVRQERHNLSRLPDCKDRVRYLRQRIDREFDSNPLRGGGPQRNSSRSGGRLLLRTPRVPGLAIADPVPSKLKSHVATIGGDVLMGEEQGTLAIADARDGRLRARLPGHGRITGLVPVPGSGRAIAWGEDDHISLVSAPAARELTRFSFGKGPVRLVVPLASGGVLAVGGSELDIVTWDARGNEQSRARLHSENAPTFMLDNEGWRTADPLPAAKFASALFDQGQINSFQLRSDIVELENDLVVFHGLATLVLWSLSQSRAVFCLNQLHSQEWLPRFIVPDGDNFILISQGGGIARLHSDQTAPQILAHANPIGGADRLDETLILTSRAVENDAIETITFETRTLEQGAPLRWQGLAGRGYFRSAESSMARGVAALGDRILAWCADGLALLYPASGQVEYRDSGSGLALSLQAGVSLGPDAVILINNERPELHTASEAGVVSLDHLLPRVVASVDLGEGRALITLPDDRTAFWNARETVDWISESQDATAAGALLQRGHAALLSNGDLIVQGSDEADPAIEFARYVETDGALQLASRSKGAWHPKPRPKPGSIEAMLPFVDRPYSHWQTMGDMLISYSGVPACVAMTHAQGEQGRWQLPFGAPLTQMVTASDPGLADHFPNLAFIASDGKHLIAATLGNGNYPAGQLALKGEVDRVIAFEGALLLQHGDGIERVVPASSLLARMDSAPLFELSSILPSDRTGTIRMSAWLADARVGLILVSLGRKGSNRREWMVVACCPDRGILAQAMADPQGKVIAIPQGFILSGGAEPMMVTFDAQDMVIRFDAPAEPLDLPVPLRESLENIHGPSDGGKNWTLASLPGVTYRLAFDAGFAALQHDRITLHSKKSDETSEAFLFPSGYDLIDAVGHDDGASLLIRAEGVLQVVRFGSAPPRSDGGAVAGPSYTAAQRRFVCRMGLSDFANQMPKASQRTALKTKDVFRAHLVREGPAEIEILVWQDDLDEAEAQLFLLEGAAFDPSAPDDADHESARRAAHRLAATVRQARGQLSLADYLSHAELRTGETNIANLAPPWLDGLIYHGLCGRLDLSGLGAYLATLSADLRAAGYDCEADPRWGDLLLMSNAGSQPAEAVRSEPDAITPAGDEHFLRAMQANKAGAHAEEREHLERAVREGHAHASYILGKMHQVGIDGTPDAKTARSLLRTAAQAGLVEAINDYSVMVRKGEGGPVDFAEAKLWARRGHTAGDELAGINYAIALLTDPGATDDDKMDAVGILNQLAQAGNRDAAQLLARLFPKQ